MSSWLEAGRPAILEAIAAACDKVDERVRAELEDRDRKNKQLLDELDALKSRMAAVEGLQQDNESLRAEIDRFRNMQLVQPPSPKKRIALGDLSPNKSSAQQRAKADTRTRSNSRDSAIIDLAAKLRETDAKYKNALSRADDLGTKIRERNAQVNQWATVWEAQKYTIQKQQEIIQKLRTKLRSHPSSTVRNSSVGAISAHEEVVELACPKRPNPLPSLEDEPTSSPPVGATLQRHSTHLLPPRTVSEPPPLVETEDPFGHTINEQIQDTETPEELDLPKLPAQSIEVPAVIIKVELSSDEPVLVREEAVRKRKYRTDEPEGGRVLKLKWEHSSSSAPEIAHQSLSDSPSGSIDYDQEVHVLTPRKRRASPQVGHDGSDTTLRERPRPGFSMTEHVTSKVSMASTTTSLDKYHVLLHESMSPKSRGRSARLDVSPDSVHAQQAAKDDTPVRPNIHAYPLAAEHMDVAADGTESVARQLTAMKGHLEALLRTSPTKPLVFAAEGGVSKVQTPRPEHDGNDDDGLSAALKFNFVGRKTSAATPILNPSVTAVLSPNPSVSRARAPKKPSILRDDMARGRSMKRKETPFREKPLDELRPEDFKPNPKYNDGVQYPYDEVVRGRDARAAIPGCIDPNCCGKTFRRFAQTELDRIGQSLTARREEVILMERYLDNDAFKLSTMEPEERRETWLKAKTWDLANKFGKHRQRYSRMPTPPGFWNVDFPNTQERAEERRQAEEIRKALVAERHREAMKKCDGMWLFRDEDPR